MNAKYFVSKYYTNTQDASPKAEAYTSTRQANVEYQGLGNPISPIAEMGLSDIHRWEIVPRPRIASQDLGSRH